MIRAESRHPDNLSPPEIRSYRKLPTKRKTNPVLFLTLLMAVDIGRGMLQFYTLSLEHVTR